MRLPARLLKRKSDTYKGDYGHVFVLGGSPGLTGAVCLCANAALRIGGGLVTVGVPQSLNTIFETKLTEVMSLILSDKDGYLTSKNFQTIQKVLSKIDAVVLGPGASRNFSAQRLMRKVIADIDKPIVVDADGINALASGLDILDKRKTKKLILTPHEGEFSRLIKVGIDEIKKRRKELVKNFALRYNLILVLKGHRTLVSDGKDFFENNTGNPGMATAGMGDVLGGMIAGLISQGVECFEAAKAGVYLHGLAADYAVLDKTQNCLIASDIMEYLPKAIKASLKYR